MSAQKSRYPKNPSSVAIKAVTIVLLFVVVIVRVGSHARLDRPMRDAGYTSCLHEYRDIIGTNHQWRMRCPVVYRPSGKKTLTR